MKQNIKLSVEALEKNQNYALKYLALLAEQKRVYYTSLINEGFNEMQALEITKSYLNG